MSVKSDDLLGMVIGYGLLVAANEHASAALTNGNCRGIYVTEAGDLTGRFADADADVTVPVAVGHHPFRLSHVRATTTATVFVGY